ncbi:MAG TPA: cyclic nucleotide-binding domain-containing protein [Thermoanaerobaculia bacterium]|nr:cyclic nucleotide-binding domain-containing protein [Thermoanaerobaculia bacterium]
MTKPVFKSTGVAGAPTPAAPPPKKGPTPQFTEEHPAGAYLFREGDLGTEMFILQDGQVEILKTVNGVDEQLAILDKGDFFGEMSLLEDLPRTATARAVTDCKVIRINGATFDQMLRTKPEIAVRIMRKLSRRLRQTDQMLREALGAPDEGPSGMHAPEMPALEKPPAPSAMAPQKLVHASGMEMHLSTSSETLIGRRDPVTGIHPDVDLTPVDTQRSTSRRHAKIYRRGGKFFACEEIGTMNGTFVNGERVETGVPVEIKPGDEVQFGLVKLVFRD